MKGWNHLAVMMAVVSTKLTVSFRTTHRKEREREGKKKGGGKGTEGGKEGESNRNVREYECSGVLINHTHISKDISESSHLFIP